MGKILVEKLPRILKSKKKLEKALEVKITNRGKELYIEGLPEKEYIAEKVLEAIDFGFSVTNALLIKENDLEFEILNIKDCTTRKDLESVRGRIIGKEGKTLKTLQTLTNCFFELNKNFVGIIGDPTNLKNAQEAITLLAKGAKQGNVYSHLERNQPKPIEDLGLK